MQKIGKKSFSIGVIYSQHNFWTPELILQLAPAKWTFDLDYLYKLSGL